MPVFVDAGAFRGKLQQLQMLVPVTMGYCVEVHPIHAQAQVADRCGLFSATILRPADLAPAALETPFLLSDRAPFGLLNCTLLGMPETCVTST